jgi:LemA protein
VIELLAVLAVLLAVCAVVSGNRFVRQRHLVLEAERQVEVELRRRHDLVPMLVEVVQAHTEHEQGLVREVLAARDRAAAGDRAAEGPLTDRLHGLVALSEGYPDLRSAGAFRQLQAQLAETEDRIAAARRFYNGNVRALNVRVGAFPSSLVASAMGVEEAEPFELGQHERALLELPPALDLRDEGAGPGSGARDEG